MLKMSPETKGKLVAVRLTPTLLAQWKAAADAADLRLSDWIRQQCNAAAAKALRAKR